MSAAVNEYSPGSIVELHSLSKVELNGKIGECGKYDNTTGRQTVILLDTKKKLAVKCINLKRPALTSEELKQADAEVDDAISRLRQCQNGQGDQKLFDSVLTSLKDIIKRYPSCGKAHMIVGDALHMASVHPKDCLPHYRRAAENGGGSHARLSYSGMLGESGDLKGEIHHIELVLQEETSFTKLSIHARLNYGNSLTQVGDYKKAFTSYLKLFESSVACELMRGDPEHNQKSYLDQSGNAAFQYSRTLKLTGKGMFTKGDKLRFDSDVDLFEDLNRFYSLQLSFLRPNLPEYPRLLAQIRSNLARFLCDSGRFDEALAAAETALSEQKGPNGVSNAQNTSFLYDIMGNCYEAQGDAMQEDEHDEEAKVLYGKAFTSYAAALEAKIDPASEIGLVRAQVKMQPEVWTYGLCGPQSRHVYVRAQEHGAALMVWDSSSRGVIEVTSQEDGSIQGFPAAPAA